MYKKWVRLSVWISILALVAANVALGFTAGRDPSLVGWWKFDEGTGTVASDSSGSGYAGNLNGDCAWAVGKLGEAIQMNGTNGYFQAPHVPLDSRTWTIAMWINPVLTGAATLFREEESASANLSLHVRVGGPNIGDQGPVRGIRLGFYSNDLETGGGLLQDYTWYHLTFWYDHEQRSRRIYVNGEQVAEGAVASPFIGKSGDIALGVWHDSQYYNGIMDDVRIYTKALTVEEIQEVMKGWVNPEFASSPSPRGKVDDVPCDVVLGWKPGQYAGTHDVYFGTAFDDVNHASRTSPSGLLVSQGQAAATYDPDGLLSFGQTYYWRIDEVNAGPDATLYKGGTWSFTTEPYAYTVKPVKATASSSLSSASGAEKTIGGSGLDALDQHSTSSSHMWTSKKGMTPIWIQYEFGQVYKLWEMWVWNSNQSVELDIGFGAKEVVVETSLDGTGWTALAGVPAFTQATAEPSYVHNTTVHFGGVQARFVRLTIKTNWADSTKQAGLSEVRFFYVPVKAFGPAPANAATDVAIDSLLNWRPGREAARHEVVLSADATAVANGTAPVKTVTEHSLVLSSLGLEYGTTYAWKVNEVNDAATPKSWEGDLWSFRTPDFGVVDDFESYDDACNRVFFAWVDGYGHNGATGCGVAPSSGNGSGSVVGNATSPFAERTVVHKGKQAMPLAYDNTAGKSLSEATRNFEPSQDWTQGGAKTLVLFFRGVVDNGAEQFYVKINGQRVDYAGATTSVAAPLWKQWNIDLASVGASLKAVKTLAIGVSGPGKGTLYIDDIFLYRVAPAVIVPTDPGADGLAAFYRMEGDVKDSSGKGYHGTAVGDPAYVSSMAGFGQAVQFEGIDDHVELPIGTLISTLTSSSFATWVNFSTHSNGSWERIFDFGTGTTAYMFLTPRRDTSGTMRFSITTASGTGESTVDAARTLPAGWHHVAVVIDGPSKTVQLCLDGDVVAGGVTNTLPKDLGKTTQNWLGRSQYSADAYFTGSLDEFRIYTRALSAGEVRYLAGDR